MATLATEIGGVTNGGVKMGTRAAVGPTAGTGLAAAEATVRKGGLQRWAC